MRDVVVPSGRVFARSYFLPFSFSIYFLYSDNYFPAVPHSSQRGEVSVPSSIEGEVTAQLVAAQQRVAELTPLAEESTNLRSRVAEARRDANEAEKAFEALSARSWKDDEEVTRVRKE